MEKLLIVGAGGLGRMVLEIASEKYDCYFVDDGFEYGHKICGTEVVGKGKDLKNLRVRFENLVVAIGNNKIRESIALTAKELNYKIPSIISSHAYVSRFCSIGEGSIVFPYACIQNGAKVGNFVVISSLVEIHHDCEMDDFVLVYPNSTMRAFSKVGRYVKIGSNVSIGNNLVIPIETVVTDGTILQEVEIIMSNKNQKDQCVLCWTETEYDKETPINKREHYIETVGQLCTACFQKTYESNNLDNEDVIIKIKK